MLFVIGIVLVSVFLVAAVKPLFAAGAEIDD